MSDDQRTDDRIVELLKAADPVPEPSPLFWEHAARRVRAAIEQEPAQESAWTRRWTYAAAGLAVATVAALLVATRPAPQVMAPPASVDVPAQIADESRRADDDTWALVAALGSDVDFDAASEGLPAGDLTERALATLDGDERAELATLLEQALEQPEI